MSGPKIVSPYPANLLNTTHAKCLIHANGVVQILHLQRFSPKCSDHNRPPPHLLPTPA